MRRTWGLRGATCFRQAKPGLNGYNGLTRSHLIGDDGQQHGQPGVDFTRQRLPLRTNQRLSASPLRVTFLQRLRVCGWGDYTARLTRVKRRYDPVPA